MYLIKKYAVLLLCLCSFALANAQSSRLPKESNSERIAKSNTKMKVEIWSDVMCPFCYIGKRKFEAALADFENRDNIEVEWKSFQLNPEMKTDTSKNTVEYLAEVKGWTMEHAQKMNKYVTDMAKESGLTYNLEKAVVANSFDAHRLSHLAKKYDKQDALEEALFKAYFTDGKNTADHATLVDLGASIGLDKIEVAEMLNSTMYAEEVQKDIYDARQVGVTGVPFFVFGNKYAVSGAQDSKTFLKNLEKSYEDWAKENKKEKLILDKGKVCTPDGDCE